MKSKKLVLCILSAMVFSFGIGSTSALANETPIIQESNMNETTDKNNEDASIDEIVVNNYSAVSIENTDIIEDTVNIEDVDDSVELKDETTDLKASSKEETKETAMVETTTQATATQVTATQATATKATTAKATTAKATTAKTTTAKATTAKATTAKATTAKAKTAKATTAKATTAKATTAKATTAKTTTTKTTTTKATTKTTAKKTVVKKYTNSELRLLSALIYSEAGNQSYKGKLAVGNVVLNRVKSKAFYHANSVKAVIYDKKWGIQFSVIKKGSNGTSPINRALSLYDSRTSARGAAKENMLECIKAAKTALNGQNNIGNYLNFNRKTTYLRNRYSKHVIIGDHIFYNIK